MKSHSINLYTELYFHNHRTFLLASYEGEVWALGEICGDSYKKIREGSYAYCYNYLANLLLKG